MTRPKGLESKKRHHNQCSQKKENLISTLHETGSIKWCLNENLDFFSRPRKAKIMTTGIHRSISRIII